MLDGQAEMGDGLVNLRLVRFAQAAREAVVMKKLFLSFFYPPSVALPGLYWFCDGSLGDFSLAKIGL